MAIRVQVILEGKEREAYKREAERAGLSLSAWMRRAAQEKATSKSGARRIRTLRELRSFWAESDAREAGKEPDWPEHLDVMRESRRSGRAPT
jgi:hypothetical protein